MRKIYWAAPLHAEKDRARNAKYIKILRDAGHKVYAPQEHGVWEDLVKKFGQSENVIREHLYKLDLQAMKEADMCIACCGNLEDPREPSEGMLWEMGWMAGAHKNVILFNEDNYWHFNLMPQFGAIMCTNFQQLLDYLDEEKFV